MESTVHSKQPLILDAAWDVCMEAAHYASPVPHCTFPGKSHRMPASTSPLLSHPFPRTHQHRAVHRKSLLTLPCLEAQSLNLCPTFILGRGNPAQVKYLLAEVFELAVKHLLVPVLLLGRQSSPALGKGLWCITVVHPNLATSQELCPSRDAPSSTLLLCLPQSCD